MCDLYFPFFNSQRQRLPMFLCVVTPNEAQPHNQLIPKPAIIVYHLQFRNALLNYSSATNWFHSNSEWTVIRGMVVGSRDRFTTMKVNTWHLKHPGHEHAENSYESVDVFLADIDECKSSSVSQQGCWRPQGSDFLYFGGGGTVRLWWWLGVYMVKGIGRGGAFKKNIVV